MELVKKYGRLSFIPFLKSSISFWHLPYSIPKFSFHSFPFHSIPYHDEELVVQNLRREPHLIVTVCCLRKRKSCCHVVAIPPAGISAPTLTVMQGLKQKKDCSVHMLFRFCVLHLYSVFFHSTQS